MYPVLREISKDLGRPVLVEDWIQLDILTCHRCMATADNLKAYRRTISQFTSLDSVRESAFFLRLNHYRLGAPVGDNLPSYGDIALHRLSREDTSLRGLLQEAANMAKSKLVLICGSYT